MLTHADSLYVDFCKEEFSLPMRIKFFILTLKRIKFYTEEGEKSSQEVELETKAKFVETRNFSTG